MGLNEGQKSRRNLGIDLLRILSMMLVVTVHVYNRGGVAAGLGSISGYAYQSNYPMRLLCMTAVDLYALISGYVLLEGRFRPGRFLELWLQVVCIGLVECGVWSVLSPESVSWETWRTALLPVTQYEFWYFTAYAGMYVLSPVLRGGVRSLSAKQAKALLLGVFALFSGGWLLGKMFSGDSFWLGGGYTTLWIVVLFVLGACLRQSGLFRKTKAWKLCLTAFFCIAALWLLRNVLFLPMLPEEVRAWGSLILAYPNPLLVLFSLCVLALFARLKPRGVFAKVIKWLAPLSFGVYIIHVHPAAWSYLENLYQPLAALPAAWILPAVLAAALGLYLTCSLLDWLRSLLFRALRIRRLCNTIDRRIFSKLTSDN